MTNLLKRRVEQMVEVDPGDNYAHNMRGPVKSAGGGARPIHRIRIRVS